jgi:DUF3060 family protein
MRLVRASAAVTLAAAFYLAATPAASLAAPDLVVRSNENKAYDCRGGSLTVDGGSNVLTLRNCAELIVNGGDNTIDAGVVESIEVSGADNRITWTESADGRRPRISNEGEGNVITSKRAPAGAATGAATATPRSPAPATGSPKTSSTGSVTVSGSGVKVQGSDGSVTVGADGSITLKDGSAAPAGGKIRVDQDGRRETYDCRGASAIVNGDRNELVFSNCDQVSVNGQGNTVAVRAVQSVLLNGNDNTLNWEPAADGSRPRISDNGRGNTVSGKR